MHTRSLIIIHFTGIIARLSNAFITAPSFQRHGISRHIVPQIPSYQRPKHTATPAPRTSSTPLSSSLTTTQSTTDENVSSSVSSAAQILEFREPRTNTTVILIGTMHYNPRSISLVESTVQSLAESNRLGSVIIESCDLRWTIDTNNTVSSLASQNFKKNFLKNEMRAAHDIALAYSRPVVLGDQRINITTDAILSTGKQTFVDLVDPVNGWKRFYTEVREAATLALPPRSEDPDYIDKSGFLDSRLLLATPSVLVKYPLAWILRYPLGGTVFATGVFVLNYIADATMRVPAEATGWETLEDLYVSVLFAVLEVLVLGRIMVKAVLADRNEVLAKNVLAQCEIYGRKGGVGAVGDWFGSYFGWLFDWVGGDERGKVSNGGDFEIVYAPDCPPNKRGEVGGEDKVVVAVLGMAHCNGMMKLLKEKMV